MHQPVRRFTGLYGIFLPIRNKLQKIASPQTLSKGKQVLEIPVTVDLVLHLVRTATSSNSTLSILLYRLDKMQQNRIWKKHLWDIYLTKQNLLASTVVSNLLDFYQLQLLSQFSISIEKIVRGRFYLKFPTKFLEFVFKFLSIIKYF